MSDDNSHADFAVFLANVDAIVAHIKENGRGLEAFVRVEKTIPDAVKILNFDSLAFITQQSKPNVRVPKPLDLSEEAFPILAAISRDELQSAGTGQHDRIQNVYLNSIILGAPNSDFLVLGSESLMRQRAALQMTGLDEFKIDGVNTPLLQLLLRAAAERLWELSIAYDLYLRNQTEVARIFRQHVTVDSFGNTDAEVAIEKLGQMLARKHRVGAGQIVDDVFTFHIIARDGIGGMGGQSEGRTWSDYERECADALTAAGFAVQVTQTTGDFGADVVVERHDLTYVVQCKWHGSAIGVKAVQEVVSSRAHYSADFAAVVSESDYTAAARELARSNNVALLSLRTLPAIEREFTS